MMNDKVKKTNKILHNYEWHKKKILITGGASFIGSSLADKLIQKGAQIRIIDDLSSGKKENISSYISKKSVEFIQKDLHEPGVARNAVKEIDLIFHLAADHGGRGCVDIHQASTASNLLLDGLIFREAIHAGVEKIVFASSGCVYPNYLQKNTTKKLYLKENLVKPPYDADNMYGWAKLMGELTLQAYHKEYGIKTASCRYFTVYGPRGVENHAVMAMIARAFIKQDPFEVWGNGKQIRNWTYIDDIVNGTILAAEKINDGTAVNLGTMERIRVIDAVHEILKYTNQKAKIKFLPSMPTGPMNRVADNKSAKKLLGWEPETKFYDGLHKTIDWYYQTKKRSDVKKVLYKILTER
jgi:nucleoside-diphosphate-sugar epimerase